MPRISCLIDAKIPNMFAALAQLDPFFSNELIRNALISVAWVIAVLALTGILRNRISNNSKLEKDTARRWLVHTRNATSLVLIGGLVIIWASELQALALSIVAIAVAFVIATKEFILCVSGTILRTVSHPFKLGDRIEIKGIRGDVIDETIFTTTLLEIGPGTSIHQHTGRAITFPNAVFLTETVTNESFTKEFVLHGFTVPVKREDDWAEAEKRLLEAARAECDTYLEDAKAYFDGLASRQELEAFAVTPRVVIQLPDPGTVLLMVRVAVPARRKGRIEQAILRRFLVKQRRSDEAESTPA